MGQRFVSITQATVKGTLVIGLIQGTLAGIAFSIAFLTTAVVAFAVFNRTASSTVDTA